MSSSRRGGVIRDYRYLQVAELTQVEADGGISSESDSASTSVRGGHGGSVAPDAISAVLAEALVNQARSEADRILAEAMRQAQGLRQQGEAEGRQRGFEVGRAEAVAAVNARMQGEVDALAALLESIQEERSRVFAAVEGELIDLAMAIARKVIGDAVARDTEGFMQMASAAAQQLGQAGPYQLRVHPEDARRLNERWPQEQRREWEIVPDDRIAVGGCIVSCGASQVDARPETQLGLIQQAFRNV